MDNGGWEMKIIKKINNNVALAIDGNEQSLVVFGIGIGFPKMPYELTDLGKIEKTFYDVNVQHITMLGDYPPEVISISANIAETARCELQCELNPNLAFTLADHLNFAMERIQKGLDVNMPIAFDIQQLYPKEFELGKKTLELLEKKLNVKLPEREIASIAMHLINAEAENEDLHSTILIAKIVTDIVKMVEDELEITFSKDSFGLNRFTMHLRYLIQRMMNQKSCNNGVSSLLSEFRRGYPEVYQCAKKIMEYLRNEWKWECNEEEIVYLMMHINRIKVENTQ